MSIEDERTKQTCYLPEMWTIEKDVIYAAIPAVASGLEYAQQCLVDHDTTLGRATKKNATWAKTMESDIRSMRLALNQLRNCRRQDS
jgi:hypothetical protein